MDYRCIPARLLGLVLAALLSNSITAAIAKADVATFAGGCFWCMEAEFADRPGITKTTVGYMAGDMASNTAPATGQPREKREVIQLQYDPKVVSYDELLSLYWRNIDPTQADGQFADRGATYQTAIFYHTEEQNQLARASKQRLSDSKKFAAPIVTEILPASTFEPAAEDHQRYFSKFPIQFHRYKEGSGRAAFLRQTWGAPLKKE